MQGRVHGEQVWQISAVHAHELVHPLDPDRPVPRGLDRERGCVVDEQTAVALRRLATVAPDGCFGIAGWEDLLLELLHRDFVVVGRLAAGKPDRGGPGHDWWNKHGGHELRDVGWVERAAWNLRKGHRLGRG